MLRSRIVQVLLLSAFLATLGLVWLLREMADVPTVDTSLLPRRKHLAPYIKSPDPVVRKMVELAELKPDDVVYDLGCGDGRILIAAVLSSGCRGVGFDIDPERVAEARENARRQGADHLATFVQQDVFTLDLSEASVVMMYLLPWINEKLVPQLRRMKDGSRIVSHDFGLGDVKDIAPDKTVAVPVAEGQFPHYIHLWITPLKQPKTRR